MGGIRTVTKRSGRATLAAIWLWSLGGLACGLESKGQEAAGNDPELERRVAELVPRLEELSGLAARGTLAVRRSSTKQLETYLLQRLDAEYPGDTLESIAAAYREFGLVPDTLDLRSLMVDLLLEQAVGYYDPIRDVLFVRDEAPAELLDGVLVHELVHALQDQQLDLDSLLSTLPGNDARSAAQAALEGHATLAMLAYQVGGSTSALPELSPEMGAALASGAQFPRLAAAPAIIREPLLFAYLGGARYVQRLWRQQGDRPAPLGRWLPASTEQLLHTEHILSRRDDPVLLTIAEPGDGWRVRYADNLGELEIEIYFKEHLGHGGMATRAATGWDGDAYALLERGGQRALVWYTVWDSEQDAEEFVEAYGTGFRARFGGKGKALEAPERRAQVARLSLAGQAAVRIVESRAGVDLEPPGAAVAER
jgi:hypothetical protein